MNVAIEHPTDRPNFAIVRIGGVGLAFSYRTLIGVSVGFGPWKVSENVWSSTTGKHLNYLNSDKDSRLPADQFAELVSSLTVNVEGENL